MIRELLRDAAKIPAVWILLILVPPSLAGQGRTIGFDETYALAEDRAQAIAKLIPGTPDFYFYSCLHKQDLRDFDAVAPLLAAWVKRHGRTPRVIEIENRQALLTFEQNAEVTFAFLTSRLGLSFMHQRKVPGEKPNLPTRLDPKTIARETLDRRAFERHPRTVNGFQSSAYRSLAAANLDENQFLSLMSKLRDPDIDGLPAMVIRHLQNRRSRGFGSLPIHSRMFLAQLEACVRQKPDLLQSSAFVNTYLLRLRPGADDPLTWDSGVREQYLDRLQAFVQRLPDSQNSLEAHVLHHRLVHDLREGKPDLDRFIAYLRLPRAANYYRPQRLRERGVVLANLQAAYATGFGRVGNDEKLVRTYLVHFFERMDSTSVFAEFLDADYLRRLFAETKILAGVGDKERWYSMLDDPSYYERLEKRVDIEFVPTQKRWFARDESVSLDVEVKNVKKLIVKVFEIDSFNYLRGEGREVDASVNLDGLVANDEKTYTYEEPALRRVRRSFELPTLTEAGVYVVEFIGNGMSSRAVIRKGRLEFVVRAGSAGHVFRVVDENGAPRDKASIWFGQKLYEADEAGEIVLPYSTQPGRKKIIVRDGKLASAGSFDHLAESYRLLSGVHVDREQLLPGKTAKILVRPTLLLNDTRAALGILENPVLTVAVVDARGTTTSQDFPAPNLSMAEELVHEFRVPGELRRLDVSLRARVRNLSLAKTVDVASETARFEINLIQPTAQTWAPMLGHNSKGYYVDLLGKDGEPKPDLAVQLVMRHRDYVDAVPVTLKTDDKGRIELGALPGITYLTCSTGLPRQANTWALERKHRSYPRRMHGLEGETLALPYHGDASELSRAVASCFELRAGQIAFDAFDKLALVDGYLELRDLRAGSYVLELDEDGVRVDVEITRGVRRDSFAIGRKRILEVQDLRPLHITSVSMDAKGADDKKSLRVRLSGVRKTTRVHVYANRYHPAFDPYRGLDVPGRGAPLLTALDRPESTYYSGRQIGDEYRYILDRRFAKKYPGNMLRRPGLLLNPWALAETETSIGAGGGAGGRFGGRGGGSASRSRKSGAAKRGGAYAGQSPSVFPDFSFLPDASRVLSNLKPNAEGIVDVDLTSLGDGQIIHVFAADMHESVYETHVRDEIPLRPRSQVLSAVFDSERHLTEKRRLQFLGKDAAITIDAASLDRIATIDSLGAVFNLFRSLTNNADLTQFAFVVDWPSKKLEEKRTLYSKHACHELHFFLYEKDRAFFDDVVRPYLENKAHKTFMDEWLLGANLARYLEPRAFGQLNVVERILLSHRISGRAASVERHVREAFELLPVDPDKQRRLFFAALRSQDLEEANELGSELSKLEKMREDARAPRESLRAGLRAKNKKSDMLRRGRPAAPSGDPMARAPAKPGAARDKAGADDAKVADEPEMEEEEDGIRLERDLGRRAEQQALYRNPDPTRRYVEHNYWHRRIGEQGADMITANAFWRDYAANPLDRDFFSENVADASNSFAEMMFALAVLDLPFEAGKHAIETEESRVTMKAASPLLVVRKEIVETTGAGDGAKILVSQNFYRLDERYRFVGQERRDAYITEEFLTDVAYGCQIVVTNPTSAPRRLDLLLQIPEGSIPVQGGFYTRGSSLELAPYATSSIAYAFYFPRALTAKHYPVQISSDGVLLASAPAVSLEVRTEPSKVDTLSWQHVSQNGTTQEVLDFLSKANINRIDLSKILWRLRDRAFFESLIATLRERHHFDSGVWSYGLYHRDARVANEYIATADAFVQACGRSLVSPLLTIDPIERHTYQHVEYEPLFNSRAHRFGKVRTILNADLGAQYDALLAILRYRPKLDAVDWMSVTYYLLLQDRVEEALSTFAKIDPSALPMRVQHDYMKAYLDFFTDDHAVARGIAEKYAEYPVDRWRVRFQQVLDQLKEAEGASVAFKDADNREAAQGALAATEASMELDVEAQRVKLQYRNLERVEVNYYTMDVESLFSAHPFVQGTSGGSFAYIRPNFSEQRTCSPNKGATGLLSFELPAKFRNANVLVEVRAAGLTKRKPYYSNSLTVLFAENQGQLAVARQSSGKPLPKVYVKVFARLPGGKVRFHKDGYTDLRGRFDYASLSGRDAMRVERYSVLVLSEQDGAVIREVAPPAQ